jgi:hypothetical protein
MQIFNNKLKMMRDTRKKNKLLFIYLTVSVWSLCSHGFQKKKKQTEMPKSWKDEKK